MTVTEIKQLIHDLVDTNSSSFSNLRMLRGMNKAQEKIVNTIIQKDSLDQWDDDNYTDLSEGYINIISGTNNYSIKEDENFAGILFVHKIAILGTATATDYQELDKDGKFITRGTGTPTKYRINGKTIIFDITPDYNATNGIYVQFTRTPKEITVLDTTKQIGIPRTFHYLLALLTAYDYARAKRMDNRNDLLQEIREEEMKLGIAVNAQSNDTILSIVPEEIDSM